MLVGQVGGRGAVEVSRALRAGRALFVPPGQAAFDEIYRLTVASLESYLGRWARSAARDDLVQETFVRVYRHLHRFDQTKKFSTWIYTIAGNLAKNELRNRSRNPLVLFQTIMKHWDADHRPLEWEDVKYKPDDLYRKRFLREKVDEAVAQLPERVRLRLVGFGEPPVVEATLARARARPLAQPIAQVDPHEARDQRVGLHRHVVQRDAPLQPL